MELKVLHLLCWAIYTGIAVDARESDSPLLDVWWGQVEAHETVAEILGATPAEFDLAFRQLSLMEAAGIASYDVSGEFTGDVCVPALQRAGEAFEEMVDETDSQ